jgi:hypothetical protein
MIATLNICEHGYYTKINNYFYDINGVHLKVPDNIELLDHHCGDKPHRWGKRDKRKLCY